MDLSNIFSYLLRALGNTSVWLQSFKPEFGLVVVYTRFMVTIMYLGEIGQLFLFFFSFFFFLCLNSSNIFQGISKNIKLLFLKIIVIKRELVSSRIGIQKNHILVRRNITLIKHVKVYLPKLSLIILKIYHKIFLG